MAPLSIKPGTVTLPGLLKKAGYTTRVVGKYAIRPCFINPRTTMVDVERMVARTRATGDSLTKDG